MSLRWSIRPNSAWSSNEKATIGKTHPTLLVRNWAVVRITVIVCKQTDDPTDNVEIVKPVRQLRNYDFQFGHSTDLDKLLQSLMIFENSKLGFI